MVAKHSQLAALEEQNESMMLQTSAQTLQIAELRAELQAAKEKVEQLKLQNEDLASKMID